MIRKLTAKDKNIFMEMTGEFYSSAAVMHPIPEKKRSAMFDELMRSNVYAECFMLECEDGTPAGYVLTAKTFSQEAGGLVVWLEEGYIREPYRSMGLMSEFFLYIEQHCPAARYRLEVEPDNPRAIALYERRGFRFIPYLQMIKGE